MKLTPKHFAALKIIASCPDGVTDYALRMQGHEFKTLVDLGTFDYVTWRNIVMTRPKGVRVVRFWLAPKGAQVVRQMEAGA